MIFYVRLPLAIPQNIYDHTYSNTYTMILLLFEHKNLHAVTKCTQTLLQNTVHSVLCINLYSNRQKLKYTCLYKCILVLFLW